MRLRHCSASYCFTKRYPFYPQQAIAPTFCQLVSYSLSGVNLLYSTADLVAQSVMIVSGPRPSAETSLLTVENHNLVWIRNWLIFPNARALKPILLAASVLLVFLNLAPSAAYAQRSFDPNARESALPNAPQPAQAANQPAENRTPQAGTAVISGTVLDTNEDVLQGAEVTLWNPSGSAIRTVESGGDGQFAFAGLAPNVYKITVTGPGMSTFTSAQIPLHGGESHVVPPITLPVSGGTTSVTVNGNKEALAEQQVQIAVHQRIVGVIPNFYTAYDWNAPPMGVKQKFQLDIRSILDPVSFLTVAGIAGAEQYKNIFPSYGGGIDGYGKRYGAALANHVSADLLSRGVFPSIFHQDPRYFYKGKGSIRSRVLYAMSAAVMTRDDEGRWRPNYSNVIGNFSAAAISNLYYPASDRGASLVVFNGLADTAGDAAENLIREFVLKKFTTHIPKGASGQP